MTLSNRPQVVTTDDPNFQTLLKTASIVETVGLNGQLVVDAANQVVQGVPALVQAQTAVALVGVNSAIAAAQAAQVTDKKFISSSVSFPVAPTSTDLTTYPGDILGSRLDTNGAVQRTLWNRTNAVWQDNGAPLATRADTNAASAAAASAAATANATNSTLNAVMAAAPFTHPVLARDYGFGATGNTGAQNKAALQSALSYCYSNGRHDLLLPDSTSATAIPLASGTVLSAAMRVMAAGTCYLTPSDSTTYLFSVRRPSVAGDTTAPGQTINGAFISDEFASGAGGMLKNVIIRNQLNTAAFTGQGVSIGDAATAPAAAAAEGVGFALEGCSFGGLQIALGLYNNTWLVRVDRCDFAANIRHLVDYGQVNKGENITFTRTNFHDAPAANSIEFQGDQSAGACNFKFGHCSFDYNVQPFLFSGKSYFVELIGSWLEWGDPSSAGTDATKNLPQVVSGAGATGNVLSFKGGAIVYIGASASRLAANGMAAGVGILLDSTQFVRTRYAPVRTPGFQVVYVNPGATTAYVNVPFAHADKGVPLVTPLNNTGAWWIDAPTTDDTDHFNIVVAAAPGASGAKFLVRG